MSRIENQIPWEDIQPEKAPAAKVLTEAVQMAYDRSDKNAPEGSFKGEKVSTILADACRMWHAFLLSDRKDNSDRDIVYFVTTLMCYLFLMYQKSSSKEQAHMREVIGRAEKEAGIYVPVIFKE